MARNSPGVPLPALTNPIALSTRGISWGWKKKGCSPHAQLGVRSYPFSTLMQTGSISRAHQDGPRCSGTLHEREVPKIPQPSGTQVDLWVPKAGGASRIARTTSDQLESSLNGLPRRCLSAWTQGVSCGRDSGFPYCKQTTTCHCKIKGIQSIPRLLW